MNASQLHRKSRKVYIVVAVTLFMVEIGIERYVHDGFIRPYLGDFIVVILLYAILMSVSYLRVITAAIFTLFFSYVVETAQYLQLVTLLGLEDNKFARIVIGTHFSWWDMLMYTLGILCVLIVELWTFKKNSP